MTIHTDKASPVTCCRRTNVNGHDQLIFEVVSGKTPRITLQDHPPMVLVEDGNGNSITLNPGGITINSAVKVAIHASQAEVSASVVTVNSPTVNFSGVVHAETVIAQQVVTPSGGNVW
jgi:hypothetical protein